MRPRSNLERWVDARRARGEIPTTLSPEARRVLGVMDPSNPDRPRDVPVWQGTVKELLLHVLREAGKPLSASEIADQAAFLRGYRTESHEHGFRRDLRFLVEYGRVFAFDQRITDPEEVRRLKRTSIRMYVVTTLSED